MGINLWDSKFSKFFFLLFFWYLVYLKVVSGVPWEKPNIWDKAFYKN